MKRTTYILIGLFVAGLCVLVGGMFVMYCLGRPHFSNQINLQGEQLTKEIPACRVIWLAQTEMHTEECSVWLANSFLRVLPSKGEKNEFSCSQKVNDYLKMTVMGDTLKILLDYPLDKLLQELKEARYVAMITGDMQLNLTQEVECVVNDIYMQKIVLKKFDKGFFPLILLILCKWIRAILELCMLPGVAGMWNFRVVRSIICI